MRYTFMISLERNSVVLRDSFGLKANDVASRQVGFGTPSLTKRFYLNDATQLLQRIRQPPSSNNGLLPEVPGIRV